jgi:signal transduction histidine kinase/response regulator of citrate/malate metabolism
MKKPGNFFLFIVLLGVGLMAVITLTQITTLQSMARIEKGNEQASLTFTINNRLEELVNLSIELENKILNSPDEKLLAPARKIKDSLTTLGYNISVLQEVLEKLQQDSAQQFALHNLSSLIDKQVDLSFNLIGAIETKNDATKKTLIDSFRLPHLSDSIYSKAISFQKGLEKYLSQTVRQNNKSIQQLASFNRLLALGGLLAVVLLGTIIIRRQKKQLLLIGDLKEARQIALQSVMAKDQFVANMSHEIRTPLNAIQGFSRLLSQTPLNKEQNRYAQIIETANKNLLNIVNDVLDFSKIEAGAFPIRKNQFNLKREIKELEIMFETMAADKGIQLVIENDKGISGFYLGDDDRLQQVLVNLIGNAIKFTDKGSVTLTTKLLAETNKEVRINFIVTDTGIGIPSDKVHSIFERFEQIDNSFSRQHGGSGLGLAIVKKLTELMGGNIQVKSELGNGSSFMVELPFEKVSDKAMVSSDLLSERKQTPQSILSKTILIAEDNQLNQMLVESILNKSNIRTVTVNNGEEAFTILEKIHIDLILMDVQMPGVDGILATKLIREKYGDAIPIIAMTAHVQDSEKQKCLQAGMNAYLTKPINEEDLINTIDHYLSKQTEKEGNTNEPNRETIKGIKYLTQICNGDKVRINFILEQVVNQLPGEITLFEKSLADKDLDAVRKYSHNFKSTLSPLDADTAVVKLHGEYYAFVLGNADMNQIIEKGLIFSEELKKSCDWIKTILRNNN